MGRRIYANQNQSICEETNGSLAVQYHSPLVIVPLHTMNQGYNRFAIINEGQIQFVDPITRQTHPAANIQNYTNQIKHLFEFDMAQEDSWFTLRPGIVHQDGLEVFGPEYVSQLAFHYFPGSQDARMCIRSDLKSFWDSNLIKIGSLNALKILPQKLNVFSNNENDPDSFPFYAP